MDHLEENMANKFTHFDEDDDDEGFITTGENTIGHLKCTLDEAVSKTCQLLIVAEGALSAIYCEKHLLQQNMVPCGNVIKMDEMEPPDTEVWGLRFKRSKPSPLYSLNETTLLCLPSPDLKVEEQYSFVSSLLKNFTNKVTVVVLSSLPLTSYKFETHFGETNTTFARTLKTSWYTGNLVNSILEQPNIVSGIPAGVLMACQIRKIPAALCVVYSYLLNIDHKVFEIYSEFLQQYEDVKKFIINNVSLCKKLHIDTGNIYM